jgi:hypothetical protein
MRNSASLNRLETHQYQLAEIHVPPDSQRRLPTRAVQTEFANGIRAKERSYVIELRENAQP